jgi:tetratricopeptide (TPR) repeat protein
VNYTNLYIQFFKLDGGGYQANIEDPYDGDPREVKLPDNFVSALEIDLDRLREVIQTVDRRTLIRPNQTRRSANLADDSTDLKLIKRVGKSLYDALFTEVVRSKFLEFSEIKADDGLRIQLDLAETPALLNLPWEYLFDGDNFLALAQDTSIVRHLSQPENRRKLLKLPLRILIMIADVDPNQSVRAHEELTALKKKLDKSLSAGEIVLKQVEGTTPESLVRDLSEGEFHIFHFIGHGGFDNHSKSGYLQITQNDGTACRLSAEELSEILLQHDTLHLALLNSCSGAETSANDSFAGTAQTLVLRGLPAVLATQFTIRNETAIAFASEFYGYLYKSLRDGSPIDAALSSARMFMRTGNDIDWGAQAIFTREKGEQIELGRSTAEAEIQYLERAVRKLREELVEAQRDKQLWTEDKKRADGLEFKLTKERNAVANLKQSVEEARKAPEKEIKSLKEQLGSAIHDAAMKESANQERQAALEKQLKEQEQQLEQERDFRMAAEERAQEAVKRESIAFQQVTREESRAGELSLQLTEQTRQSAALANELSNERSRLEASLHAAHDLLDRERTDNEAREQELAKANGVLESALRVVEEKGHQLEEKIGGMSGKVIELNNEVEKYSQELAQTRDDRKTVSDELIRANGARRKLRLAIRGLLVTMIICTLLAARLWPPAALNPEPPSKVTITDPYEPMKNPDAAVILGDFYMNSDPLGEATKYYEIAAIQNNERALLQLGKLNENTNPDKARKYFDRAKTIGSGEGAYRLGLLLYKSMPNNSELSERSFSEAKQRNYKLAQYVIDFLGAINRQPGDCKKAESLLGKLEKEDAKVFRESDQFRDRCVTISAQVGAPDDTVISQNCSASLPIKDLGDCALKQGNFDEAVRAFDEALRYDSQNLSFIKPLIISLCKRGAPADILRTRKLIVDFAVSLGVRTDTDCKEL